MLSPEQEYTFDIYRQGKNIFITGGGGVGKSFLIKEIVKDAISRGKKVALTAMTGRASILLGTGAQTFHSWAGIGLGKGSVYDLYTRVCKKDAKDRWLNTDLLIVDEVSMMSHYLFFTIYELAKRLLPNGLCGGIQVIFSADFFQLPPIGDGYIIESKEYCFQSEVWDIVFPIENQIEFITNFRQTDSKFKHVLNRIRRGKMKQKDIKLLESLTQKEYPNEYTPCFLCPTRKQVDRINFKELEKLSTETKTYLYKEVYPVKHKLLTQKEMRQEIDKMRKNLPIEEELILKIGAQVMCTYNIDVPNGICNGSQGKVLEFRDGHPVVEFINGITMTIKPLEFEHDMYTDITIVQIPLILAWATTIHRIQGATLDIARINAGEEIFERGQLYVALSRVRSLDGLYLTKFHPTALKTDPVVLNFYEKFD